MTHLETKRVIWCIKMDSDMSITVANIEITLLGDKKSEELFRSIFTSVVNNLRKVKDLSLSVKGTYGNPKRGIFIINSTGENISVNPKYQGVSKRPQKKLVRRTSLGKIKSLSSVDLGNRRENLDKERSHSDAELGNPEVVRKVKVKVLRWKSKNNLLA